MKQLISRIWAVKGRLLASIFLLLFLGLNWLWMDFRNFMTTPLDLTQYQKTFIIKKGASIHRLARYLQQAKVIKHQNYLKLLAYWNPDYQKLKAGQYAINDSLTPVELLQQLTRGVVVQYPFTIIEGQTIYQVLENLKNIQDILPLEDHQLKQLAQTIRHDQGLLAQQLPGQTIIINDYAALEGWFLPETYNYSQGDTALSILKRAYSSMRLHLNEEWQSRDLVLPYKTPYDTLIMASIIEKETGIAKERARIAGVFVRRLQKRMRLQTDPTVIYGIGPSFNGNITKRDLKRLTPYNTYRVKGLPPTPIAMPSLASIKAALHPSDEKVLYFVADGTGGHYFSETLEEHLKAVRRMITASRKKTLTDTCINIFTYTDVEIEAVGFQLIYFPCGQAKNIFTSQ
ncbi:MAG: endolytic transglycosylase MltG [Enterobacterales bacterium]|nr:endolytic transglycosylase MltG [Enterobacterales bacterium]